MQTSARNQFEGTVTVLKEGTVNDEVEIRTPEGVTIVAVVTRESTAGLGLAVGKPAIALIKASSIIVVTDEGRMRLSARNRLAGTVAHVRVGAVNAEVVIDVPGGLSVATIVTLDSAQRLGLAVGTPATAIFKASSVIVGATA